MRFDRARLALPAAAVCGVLATLGFGPFGGWPLALVGYAGLFALAEHQGWRRAALIGWIFGFAHFGTGVYWVYISTHVYGGAPAWLGALLAAALFLYLGVYPALVAAIAARLRWLSGGAGWIATPALGLIVEMARGYSYGKFPWMDYGYVLLDTPARRLAPLLGVYGLTALALLLSYALFRLARGSRPEKLAAAVVLFAPLLTVLLPAPSAWTRSAGAPLTAALVQSDIKQDEKWKPYMRIEALYRHQGMTQEAWPADLVIWPEVALTQPYEALADDYLPAIDADAKAHGGGVLIGILIGHEGEFSNSLLALGAAQGRYDKVHLAPFGEYFPVPDFLLPLMQVLNLPFSDFVFGAENQAPITLGPHRIAAGICFDDAFASDTARGARDAEVLVNVTNDAWFAGSSAPAQHLQFSRMRAAETGRWMLRAANTGISALITPDGEIAAQLPQFQQRVLKGNFEPRTGATPYMRWRDRPLWALCALALGYLGWRRHASLPARGDMQ